MTGDLPREPQRSQEENSTSYLGDGGGLSTRQTPDDWAMSTRQSQNEGVRNVPVDCG